MKELLNQGLPDVYQGYINRNGTKKFKFWKHLINKQKVYIGDLNTNKYVPISQECFSIGLRKLKIALDNHCRETGKKWCFNFSKYLDHNLVLNHITLYIPEMYVERMDSSRLNHTFKNFCIKIFIKKNENNIVFSVLDIFKITIEEKEIILKNNNIRNCAFTYHPHHRKVYYNSLIENPNLKFITQDFCYGSGDMSYFMNTLPFKNYETIEDIEFILYSIEEYYKSESPEGGAYNSVANLSDNREQIREQNISIEYIREHHKERILTPFLLSLVSDRPEEFFSIVKKCDFIQNKSAFVINPNSVDFFYTEFLALFYSNFTESEIKTMLFTTQTGICSLYSYETYLKKYEELEKNEEKSYKNTLEVIKTGKCVTIDDITIPVNIYRKSLNNLESLPNKIEINLNSFSFPEELFKKMIENYVNEKINERIYRKAFKILAKQ